MTFPRPMLYNMQSTWVLEAYTDKIFKVHGTKITQVSY